MRAPACTAATLAPMGALPPPSPRSPRGRYSRLLGSRSVVASAAGRVGSGRATGYSLGSPALGQQLTRGMLWAACTKMKGMVHTCAVALVDELDGAAHLGAPAHKRQLLYVCCCQAQLHGQNLCSIIWHRSSSECVLSHASANITVSSCAAHRSSNATSTTFTLQASPMDSMLPSAAAFSSSVSSLPKSMWSLT